MSAPPDSTLANPEQLIADLQRQLAEREAELADHRAECNEALQREAATAEVLQVINSSPGDLGPVFDVMLEKAMSLCSAIFGELHTYDGVSFKTSATRGHSAAFAEARAKNPPAARPGTASARILETKRPVHILDIKAEESYRERSPASRALIDLGGTRTTLAVPLLKNDTVLGFISFHRDEVKPFSDKQIALLQNFAAQAVIAMENARLLNETREALEQQTATADVLQVINSSPGNLPPVFEAILEKAHTLCGAEFGSLFLYDGEHFRAIASHGVPEALASRLREGIGNDTRSSQQLIAGEPFAHVHDSALEEHAVYRGMDIVSSHRTLLSVPLRKGDALLGKIVAGRLEVRPFTDKQIALLQNFAAQAAIAMENARLITETREALEQQTATAQVLQVINSSPSDLAPVFDAILEKAMHLCGAAFGEFRARDGDSFRSAATRGVPAAFAEYRRDNAFVAEPGSLGARILAGEQVVHVLDLKDEDVYRAGYRNRRALVDLGGARTALVASLRKDDTVLGFIIVYRQEVRPFTDKQIALLQNFADQAVIAMENARLLGELRQRTDEVAELNRGLEARVAEQVDELGRVGRLKRFLAPQLAELIVSQGDEKILESHRREIVVVFCDLRGYTAFTETAEPEEVLEFLREYHGALGPLVSQFEGTLDQFSGDGIMVFFNDPVDLKDLGVALVGHRRRLLDAIAALAAAPPAAVALAREERGAAVSAEAERRQLTVMFCDLVGSTPLSTRFDPEDLREIVGAYHRCVADTVGRFGGFVAKYMGDGVLIYFGYPEAHEDDAERAVRAGLAVIDEVVRLATQEPLNVRIGIATGVVVVGDLIGAGAAQERDVVGETPNLGARLQALARPGTLVVADGTRRQIGTLFEIEDLGLQPLAGFAEPQRAS